MNIYERLEKYGWKWTNGNSRYDCYRKGNWSLMLSKYFPSKGTGEYFYRIK